MTLSCTLGSSGEECTGNANYAKCYMKEIVDHFGVHYSTVDRAVRAFDRLRSRIDEWSIQGPWMPDYKRCPLFCATAS